MKAWDDRSVCVVGTGLIGGSILRRLIHLGVNVIGCDPDPHVASIADEEGIPFTADLRTAVHDRDLVFCAAPLSKLPMLMDEVAALTGDDCVITDVGSAKRAIAEHVVKQPYASRFVGGHPMAGTEHSGLESSEAALFDSAAWVLCPTDASSMDSVRFLTWLITSKLGASVVPMRSEIHDAAVALSSHIPHLLAGALAGAAEQTPNRAAVLGLAAGSFKDGTRVAGTIPERTIDMLVHNREAVLEQWDGVSVFLDQLVEAVRSQDFFELERLLALSRGLRQELADNEVQLGNMELDFDSDETESLLCLGETGGRITKIEVSNAPAEWDAEPDSKNRCTITYLFQFSAYDPMLENRPTFG